MLIVKKAYTFKTNSVPLHSFNINYFIILSMADLYNQTLQITFVSLLLGSFLIIISKLQLQISEIIWFICYVCCFYCKSHRFGEISFLCEICALSLSILSISTPSHHSFALLGKLPFIGLGLGKRSHLLILLKPIHLLFLPYSFISTHMILLFIIFQQKPNV